MTKTIANIFKVPDLRNRILFTLAMLAVYRMGIFVPAPGVNTAALKDYFGANSGTLFGLYDMFSGGALMQFSVFVLGIMPYITASIIMQVLKVAVPKLERLSKEGQQGQNKITQYTRYMTIGIALVQSFGIAVSLESMKAGDAGDIVLDPGLSFRMMTVLTMTAGSCFVMWLGEQITDRGIGNGASLIITCGIIAALPSGAAQVFEMVQMGQINLLFMTIMLGFMFLVVAAIVFIERGQRRIPIQYAKRVIGRRVYGGQSTHLPLKVNTAGVIPPIFASSFLMFPATLGTFFENPIFETLSLAFMPGEWLYNLTFVALIIFFAYFYTAITFNPVDVADNLKRHGGYISNVRPGKETADEIEWLLTRLTAGGAVYLAAVCILPTLLISAYNVPFYFGGTGLLIIVGVCLQTVAEIEAHLLTRHYDGVMGGGDQQRSRHRRALEREKQDQE